MEDLEEPLIRILEDALKSSSEEDEPDGVDILHLIAQNEDALFGDADEPRHVEIDHGLALFERNQRNCVRLYVESTVSLYSDTEFLSHFRLKRSLAQDIARRFQDSETFQRIATGHGGFVPVSPEKHVLAFLWFVGHQSASYRDVADRFDLSLSSLHKVISRVIDFLLSWALAVIKDPSQDEKRITKEFYHRTRHLNGVIGSIDGTHIRIDKPSQDKDAYINRKKYFSIHMQGLVNEHARFLDVFIGYPGSVHDARVFANSPVSQELQNICQPGEFILGDAAYPCLPFLIAPYRDNGHLSRAQKYFNRQHSSCRMSVEHAFGILKQRFRQLYFLKLRDMQRMVQLIHACCVLHNIADLEDLNHFEPPDADDYPDRDAEIALAQNQRNIDIPAADEDGDPEDTIPGRDLRDELCRQVFAARPA